ncbi:hypothetical protein B4U37_08945 [Sutcliffiella horikoshii]|uniref:Uncharacterized protein n=1 Tax=Sutcliffiella horikoshii TaxID=79883 RepID=A0ABM6KHZ5_9BACI|nr:hypothetical protein B4U37_08945 [Sutcliffiella horikoshii]
MLRPRSEREEAQGRPAESAAICGKEQRINHLPKNFRLKRAGKVLMFSLRTTAENSLDLTYKLLIIATIM